MVSHVYYDKKSKKPYFYFSDFVTAKKIEFHDMNGKKIKSVDVDSIVNSGYDIEDIYVESFDSIYLLRRYKNELTLINSDGIARKNSDLSDNNQRDVKLEFGSSIFSGFGISDSKFILAVDVSNDNDFGDVNKVERLKSYYNTMREMPAFIMLEFNSRSKSFEYKEIFKGLRKEFTKRDQLIFELSYHYVDEKYLIYSSWYSNRLFIYDHQKRKKIKSLKIESDYTSIGGAAFAINEQNLNKMDSLLLQKGAYNGGIRRFFFDKARDLLYVIVSHEQKIKIPIFMGD
jgi:hypothetical protein